MNDFRYVSPSVCLIIMSKRVVSRVTETIALFREDFCSENKKSPYLRRIVGLKGECLFKSGGRGSPHGAAVFVSVSETAAGLIDWGH